jgi:hypothetical protein
MPDNIARVLPSHDLADPKTAQSCRIRTETREATQATAIASGPHPQLRFDGKSGTRHG